MARAKKKGGAGGAIGAAVGGTAIADDDAGARVEGSGSSGEDQPGGGEEQATVPASGPELRLPELLDIDKVIPTPQNPRDPFTMDDPKVIELSESIAATGLEQPVICRPHPERPGFYDLRAGHRRLTACTRLGWRQIPGFVREMDDLLAMRITMDENVQRQDLTPLEEAKGIAELLHLGDSVEQVADRYGVTKAWVLRRAKIHENLSASWRERLKDKKAPRLNLDAMHLELIARLPQQHQEQLFKDLSEEMMAQISVRDLAEEIGKTLLTLSSAPWDLNDVELLPAAGACAACMNRSEAQHDLFEEFKGKKGGPQDRCLLPSCFESKRLALVRRSAEEARRKYGNVPIVLDGRRGLSWNDEKQIQKGLKVKGDLQRFGGGHETEFVPEGTAGAKPVVLANGPDAAKVVFYRKKPSVGSGYMKSPAEKNAELLKKRAGHAAAKLRERLKTYAEHFNPDLIGEPLRARIARLRLLFGTEGLNRELPGQEKKPQWERKSESEQAVFARLELGLAENWYRDEVLCLVNRLGIELTQRLQAWRPNDKGAWQKEMFYGPAFGKLIAEELQLGDWDAWMAEAEERFPDPMKKKQAAAKGKKGVKA